ncbi:MAG: hypothetical protein HC899_27475, partial [Leptolyngbyaceae cyanobacterium SM1_4_3]|nr:hypothetical protein [Leptolyngbyaceae cyanobacterium SM1_4_3]
MGLTVEKYKLDCKLAANDSKIWRTCPKYSQVRSPIYVCRHHFIAITLSPLPFVTHSHLLYSHLLYKFLRTMSDKQILPLKSLANTDSYQAAYLEVGQGPVLLFCMALWGKEAAGDRSLNGFTPAIAAS